MINELIINTLKGIAPTYVDYAPDEVSEYIVFTYRLKGSQFADNNPSCCQYDVTLNYVSPAKKNVIAKRKAIIKALNEIGTYPNEVNASTNEYQNYSYSTYVVSEAIL